MIILSIRTDNPEAEIGIFDNDKQLDYIIWQAHRELAETIFNKIKEMLENHGKDWPDIEGIIVFKGPGSFTGLRIGLSIVNAVGFGLHIPIVGTQEDDWVKQGIKRLEDREDDKLVLPEYGSPVHITLPRN